MNFAITPADMIEACGLRSIVYFPQYPIEGVDPRAAGLLSSTGLPHSEIFASRNDPEAPYTPDVDPITVGSRFAHYGMSCPAESRSWWTLGYLFTSLTALDPVSGQVYAFPEGSSDHILLHRDVESLMYSLIELRKLEVGHAEDVGPEEPAGHFKRVVSAFDPTPFAHEESQGNLALEELEHGIW